MRGMSALMAVVSSEPPDKDERMLPLNRPSSVGPEQRDEDASMRRRVTLEEQTDFNARPFRACPSFDFDRSRRSVRNCSGKCARRKREADQGHNRVASSVEAASGDGALSCSLLLRYTSVRRPERPRSASSVAAARVWAV